MKISENRVKRYENEDGKLHNENGPALVDYSKSDNDYNEWWENGVLHAVFDKNILKRTTQNSFNTLEEVELPKKWKGYETTLNISDIKLLNFAPKLIEVIPEIKDGYRANYQDEVETYKTHNGLVIRNSLEDGKLHKQDGPALINPGLKYAEWWDKGRLVATVKDGEIKRSIDGTFEGLKEVEIPQKWKGHENTLSLTDLEHCGFKSELLKIEREEIKEILSTQFEVKKQPMQKIIEVIDGYKADYRDNLKSIREVNGLVIRNSLEDGKLHKQDGPALINPGLKYAEWWDKGRLVATVKDGEIKRSIDGTFEGLKEVEIPQKWKGHENTLSLTDLEHCGFKQNLINNHEKDKPLEINMNGIKSKIGEMRKSFIEQPEKTSGLKMK